MKPNSPSGEPKSPSGLGTVPPGFVGDLISSLRDMTDGRDLREMLERQKRTLDMAMVASHMGTWRYTLADNICVYDENDSCIL